jgi:uncharacterized repeat protein (TIGR03803 family)
MVVRVSSSCARRCVARSLALAVMGSLVIGSLGTSIAVGSVPATIIASFDGTNGATPYGGVVFAGNQLIGTTSIGGANNLGTVFSVNRTSGSITTMATFDRTTNGAKPRGGLIQYGNGLLGGTTSEGGAVDRGTVFSIPTTGGTLITRASFGTGTGDSGLVPYGPLTQVGSVMYGTSTAGGAGSGGAVFSINGLDGAAAPTSMIASFDTANGATPRGKVIYTGTSLVGTTFAGGANGVGTIFSVPLAGGPVTTLATFDTTNGANPDAGLTLVGGKLYGTTTSGGPDGRGTVFSIPVAGGSITTMAAFSFDGNGRIASSGLTLIGDKLFGSTQNGGTANSGTVYSIPLAGGAITTEATFGGVLGSFPQGELTLGIGTNRLFGTTVAGGANGLGTVFSVPLTPLVGDFDGNFLINARDIDLLFAATAGSTPSPANPLFDVNADGQVIKTINTAGSDVDYLVGTILHTHYGDATLDQTVNFDDLVILAQNYNGTTGGWAQGNFDGVGGTNFGDLVLLAQNYNAGPASVLGAAFSADFAADWRLAQALVPEPGACALLALGTLAISRARFRRRP